MPKPWRAADRTHCYDEMMRRWRVDHGELTTDVGNAKRRYQGMDGSMIVDVNDSRAFGTEGFVGLWVGVGHKGEKRRESSTQM